MSPKERTSLLRRGFLLGYFAAFRRARKDLYAMAANFDAEIASLRDEYREIGEIAAEVRREFHRDRVNRAVREAVDERAMIPDAWLN